MEVSPYLDYDGRCEEAINFYKAAVGAEVKLLVRVKESPDPHPPGMIPPGSDEKIMHANLRIGTSTVLFSDGRCQGQPNFKGLCLSLSAADAAEADRLFAGLLEGGQVTMPMGKTFFSPRFGMLTDRFGMHWMVIVPM